MYIALKYDKNSWYVIILYICIYIYRYVYIWIYRHMHYVYKYIWNILNHPCEMPVGVLGSPVDTLNQHSGPHLPPCDSWLKFLSSPFSSLFRATVFDSHFKWQLTDGLRARLKVGPLDSSATRGLHSTAQWQQIAGIAGTHAALRKWVFVFPSCCQNKPERSIPRRNLSEKPDSFTGREVSEGSVFSVLFTSSYKLRVAKNRP